MGGEKLLLQLLTTKINSKGGNKNNNEDFNPTRRVIDNFQLHGCPSNGSNETRSVVGGFEKATNDSFILQQTETTTYTNLTCDLYTYCKASAKMNGTMEQKSCGLW